MKIDESMAQKRKLDDDDCLKPASKQAKKANFSAADFKTHLQNDACAALVTFINCARAYPDESDFDIVDDWLKGSNDCTDILKVLDAPKFKTEDVFLVVELMQLILTRVANDLKKYRTPLNVVVRQLLASPTLSKFSRLLAMRNKSSHIKAVLKLMMALVGQGTWAARDVMTFVEVNSSDLMQLLNRRDMKDEEDVRMCVTELVVSLLVCEDNSIIKRLLSVKGILNKIAADLHGDTSPLIVLFLSALHKKIVCNPSVTKTSKIHFFHDQTLSSIARLYRWTGPKHWKEMVKTVKGGKSKTPNVAVEEFVEFDLSSLSSEQIAVRDVAHSLLVELCCSIKNGIVFLDKTFSTSGQNMNHTLTNFLNVFRKPYEDPLKYDLVVGILRESPDQLHYYLPSLAPLCVPKQTSGWLESAKFVRKIYEKQPLISPAVKFFSSVPTEELADTILSTVLPPTDLWMCFKEAATSSCLPLVHESLLLVSVIVRRLTATLKHLQKNSASAVNSCCDINHCMTLVRDTFVQQLPGTDVLFDCWHKAIFAMTSDGEAVNDSGKESSEGLPTVPVPDQLTLILQLFCSYYNLFPDMCCQNVVDFSNLLDGLEKAGKLFRGESEHSDNLPYLYILRLLSVSGVQLEDLIRKTSSGDTSILSSLLKVMISVRDDHLRESVYNLLAKLICGSPLFSKNIEEMQIWLDHLMSVSSENVDGCLLLFVSSLSDSLADPSLSESTDHLQFSSLVQRILKQATDQDAFVDGALVDILHLQSDPLVLCKVIKKAAAKLPRTSRLIGRYLTKAALQGKVELSVSEPNTLTIILENSFTCGKNLSSNALVSFMESLSLREFWKLSRQVLSYLNSTVQQLVQSNKQQKDEISFYLDLLTQIEIHSRKLSEQHKSLADQREIDASDDLLALDIPEEDSSEVFYNLCWMIFHSSIAEKYFLGKPTDNCEVGKTTPCIKVSRLITRKLSLLAEDVVCHFGQQAAKIFDVLICRVETEMSAKIFSDEMLFAANGLLDLVQLPLVQDAAEALISAKSELTDDKKQLNQRGNVFVKAFKRLVGCESVPTFSKNFISMVFDWVEVGVEEFCRVLVELIKKVPECCGEIMEDTTVKLLKTGNRHVLSVVVAMTVISESSRNHVKNWCTHNKKWRQQKAEYQEVIGELMQRHSENDEFTKVVFKVYWSYLLDVVCKGELTDKSHQTVVKSLLCHLIRCATSDDIDDCWNRLTAVVSNQLTPSMIELYVILCRELFANSSTKGQEHCCQFVGACVEVLTSQLSAKAEKSETFDLLVETLTKFLLGHKLEALTLREKFQNIWDAFVKEGLRHRSTDHLFLKLLEELISQLFPQDESLGPIKKNGLTIENIFEMIISLSHFLPTIIKDSEDEVKDAVISLLYCLVSRSSDCCKPSHITFLFGAYHATICTTDQRILQLLRLYENAGCPVTDFKPYFWGQKAIQHHASKKTLGMSLQPQSKMEEVIDLLDKSLVYQSLLNFPLRRKLELGDRVRDANYLKSDNKCYDPAFLLPLFSHLLEPDNSVNCVKLIEHHCLGYVLVALGSHDADIRRLAYHTLSAFCVHLDRDNFPEKLQVSYILEFLRNSVVEPNLKLANIITVFFAKAIHLMLHPKDHMYSLINEFLLLKPALDTNIVPEFYKLFFTSGLEYKIERSWILNLLLDGLRDTHDYHVIERHFIFKIIMGFCTFSASDTQTKILVLRILTKACGVKTVARDLIESHGLLSWIANISADVISEKRSIQATTGLISSLVEILHSLWNAIVDWRSDYCIQPVITAEILMTVKKIIRCFQKSFSEYARDTCEQILRSAKQYSLKTSLLHQEWKDLFSQDSVSI